MSKLTSKLANVLLQSLIMKKPKRKDQQDKAEFK